jgi:predicted neutral ceramidase superfamily lipid hydrolase
MLIFGLIVLHGHKSIYFQGIQLIFGLAVDADSHHAGSGLLRRLISDHFWAFQKTLSIMVIGSWIAQWVCKQKIILASAVILACALLLFYANYVHNQWSFFVPGICYVVLLSIVFLESEKILPWLCWPLSPAWYCSWRRSAPIMASAIQSMECCWLCHSH